MNIYLPKDRVTNTHQGYGFVEFRGEEDADYVSTNTIALFSSLPFFFGFLSMRVSESVCVCDGNEILLKNSEFWKAALM